MENFLKQIPGFVEDGLSIDLGTIGLQLIVTLVLFTVVFIFLWKPLTRLLEQRREIITNDLDEAKEANAEAHKIKEQFEARLLEAKTEAKEIIESSKERGEEERTRIISNAEKEAVAKLQKAGEDIAQEYQKARENIKEEIIDVAFEVAEKIIEKEIDPATHKAAVKDFIKEVDKNVE